MLDGHTDEIPLSVEFNTKTLITTCYPTLPRKLTFNLNPFNL